MKPVRVLLVAPSLDIVGGHSVQAQLLLDELREQDGIEVAFQPINPRLPGFLRLLQRIKYVRTLVTEAAYIAGLLWRLPRHDVVHVFAAGYWSFVLAPAPCMILGRLFGDKTIVNYHDGRADDHLRRFPRALGIIRRADRVVTPSAFLVDVFARFQVTAQPIFNIVDTRQFHYRERPHPRPLFLHNRGLEPHYNTACTLRAFAAIQAKYPDARLRLAHDGSERRSLEGLAASFGLKHVEFLGRVSPERMRELYDEADIFLMSPDIDNMPLSVLECFASGLPFVSTRAGGVPYIVENERTGLLVALNDHAALAAAALRLLEEEGLAVRLARNGHAECERYAGTVIAEQWARLYRELAGQTAPSGA